MNNFRSLAILGFAFLSACGSVRKPKGEAATTEYKGLGAESVAPEVVRQFAPAPLPPELSGRVQQILDVRSPGAGILSPDGKSLFFSWRVTGTSQIWRIDGPKSFPLQMTGGEDNTSLADLTPDGRFLILSRDRKGEENPGLYLQSVAGGALQAIQHVPKIQTTFEFVSNDSRYIYYRSNNVKPDSYALYRYDLQAKKSETLFTEDGTWFIADYREDLSHLLLGKQLGSREVEYYDFDAKTKKLEPIIGQGEKEEYSVGYAANRGAYLVLTPKFGEFRKLYELKGGKWRLLGPNLKFDIEEFSMDRAGKRIVFTTNRDGYSKLYALNAKTYTPIALPSFTDADQVYPGKMSRNGRHLIVTAETAKAPRASFVLDWETGKLTQWVVPSSPEIDTSKFTRATLESYPARDGTRIPMFVYRPPACTPAPCPVVVEFHGGPEGQSRPGFNLVAQVFVAAGFTYVEPNVRGSDGYGKTWFLSDNGAKRLNVITDIEDAAKFIRANWAVAGVVPKLGITGGSYGGYSTLYGMTKFAGAYDAGVAIVGMSNLVSFLMNTAPYRRKLRISEYGDPSIDREALVQLSPVTFLNQIKGPLLIIQGVSDPRVPAGEAIQMYNAMKAKGLSSELILFGDEGHGASKRENQVYQFGHSLRFFQETLK